tara:strand:+ start:796 stop:2661 length:1866 start_codon:yes stop_codon:yes gene_type:complete
VRDLRIRWFVIVSILICSAYNIWPTYKYYFTNSISDDNINVADLSDLKSRAINLGLDLQGGMYVLLEVNVPELVLKIANKKSDQLIELINDSKQQSTQNQSSFFDELKTLSDERDIKLTRYYSNLEKGNVNIINELINYRNNAINSILEIIRNRIDEFGVSEPNIQKYGNERIIVELAGIKDPDRARNLIQRTATLEFSLVLDEKMGNVIESIDKILVDKGIIKVLDKPEITEVDENSNLDEIFSSTNSDLDISNELLTTQEDLKGAPFSGYLKATPNGIGVLTSEYEIVNDILMSEEVQTKIPRDGKFLWSSNEEKFSDPQTGTFFSYKSLFYVRKNPEIQGGMIKNPNANIGGAGTDVSGQWVVNVSMNKEGTNKWRRFTGLNINKRVAIILDNKVYMAPFIRDKIPTGQTQISGFSDVNEAKDIANVLRAGELPASVDIIEERTVGPSLGVDSINSGRNAMLIGFLFVIIFMIIYYKACGFLANLALILNLILVVAILSGIGATLTLPGIAGLILTIGMSVDSNVIIFERIKEELSVGKNVKAAIESGYSHAFITIMDANVTTLIAAFVLAWIGSGPIKGFAITLSTGILCSMFTAIYITRTIFLTFTNNRITNKLSI